ncbi:hypothetical protein CIK05_11855 [Bdellovibrio sp. qaytius]|nr:hypothetical protein CIK05_11855 [Bdellovibrio sp. qaytius]
MSHSQSQVDLYTVYEKMVEYFTNDSWIDLIKLTDSICDDVDNIDRANRGFWFHRAISLECTGKSTEAILIYKILMQKYPLEPFYHKSLIQSIGNFEQKIVERYSTKTIDESFLICLNFFETHYYISWEIRKIQFTYLIQEKRCLEVSNLANMYLDLNPYDFDYLSELFKLAQKICDDKLLKRIINICSEIPDHHMDKIKIERMLFNFFESSQGDGLC